MLANPIYSMSEMQVGYIYEDSTLNLLKKKTKQKGNHPLHLSVFIPSAYM